MEGELFKDIPSKYGLNFKKVMFIGRLYGKAS